MILDSMQENDLKDTYIYGQKDSIGIELKSTRYAWCLQLHPVCLLK